jgi:hypothetical protein
MRGLTRIDVELAEIGMTTLSQGSGFKLVLNHVDGLRLVT